jgi:putative serine protease PepD
MTTTDPAPPSAPTSDPTPARGGRSRGWLVGLLVSVAAVAFVAGFVLREELRDPPAPTPTPADPAALVARKLLPSTVYIRVSGTAGSGFVYNAGGLVLTAAHVVGDNDEVTVRLSDGTPLAGKVLGRDTGRDVAVVKIERKGLVAAAISRGPIRVGEMAVAIGSPFGDRETVTAGVISGIGGTLTTPGGTVDVIRTDAAINTGNSGGPLVDREGRVIGINVALRGTLGLAVPIDVALETAKHLEQGKAAPPVAQLGVSGTDPADPRAGALVREVTPGSAAAEAGIKEGDLITEIDGKRLQGMFELSAAIRKHKPGDEVMLTVVTDEVPRPVKVKLGSYS